MLNVSPRTAAFTAVTAAKHAAVEARNANPSHELQQAVEIAHALEREITGRSHQGHEYKMLRELRREIGRLGDRAVAAVESLSAANDAVTSLRLDGDPTNSALAAIDAALRSGIDRAALDEAIRAARFR